MDNNGFLDLNEGMAPFNMENNQNINFNEEADEPGKITIFFVLLISLILVGMDFVSLYYSYNYLIESINTTTTEVFDQCIKFPVISEMFFTVFATLAGMSAILLSFGFLFFYEIFVEKLLNSFFYFNYYIFGPLLLASSILGLIKFDNIAYVCEESNPKVKIFNLSIVICLIIILVFGTVITATYSSMTMFEYFSDSVRFTKDGSYLIGKTFWKYVFSRNRIVNIEGAD